MGYLSNLTFAGPPARRRGGPSLFAERVFYGFSGFAGPAEDRAALVSLQQENAALKARLAATRKAKLAKLRTSPLSGYLDDNGFDGFAAYSAFAGKKKSNKASQMVKLQQIKAMQNIANKNTQVRQTQANLQPTIVRLQQENATLRSQIAEEEATARTDIGESNLTQRTDIAANAAVNAADIAANQAIQTTDILTGGKVDITDIKTTGKVDIADIDANRQIALQGDKGELTQMEIDRQLALRDYDSQDRQLTYDQQMQLLQFQQQSKEDDRQAELDRMAYLQDLEQQRLDYQREQSDDSSGNFTPMDDVDWDSSAFEAFSDEPSASAAFLTRFGTNYSGPVDAAQGLPAARPLHQSGVAVDPRMLRLMRKRGAFCNNGMGNSKCDIRAQQMGRYVDGGVTTTFADTPDEFRSGVPAVDAIRGGINTATQSIVAAMKQANKNTGYLPRMTDRQVGQFARQPKPCCGGCATGAGCEGGGFHGAPRRTSRRCDPRARNCNSPGVLEPVALNYDQMDMRGPCTLDNGCKPRLFEGDPQLSLPPLRRTPYGYQMTSKGSCFGGHGQRGCGSNQAQVTRISKCGMQALQKVAKRKGQPQPVFHYRVLRRVSPLLEW